MIAGPLIAIASPYTLLHCDSAARILGYKDDRRLDARSSECRIRLRYSRRYHFRLSIATTGSTSIAICDLLSFLLLLLMTGA